MYCPNCGIAIQSTFRFCGRCGSAVSAIPAAGRLNASSTCADESRRKLLICLGLSFFIILGFHDLAVFPAIATVFVFFYIKQISFPVPYKLGLLGALVAATLVVQILHNHDDQVRESLESPVESQPAQIPALHRPTVPPPKFTLFRGKKDEIVTFVVPTDTTDDQLRSLIWLFREKVRSGKYGDIGILLPTAKQWGVDGYDSGLLDVYRGRKCANEAYIPLSDAEKGNLGPCGWGVHVDAWYQWGINGSPSKDAGDIRTRDGKLETVFDYNDSWQPTSK
jgi:hypothetical protein